STPPPREQAKAKNRSRKQTAGGRSRRQEQEAGKTPLISNLSFIITENPKPRMLPPAVCSCFLPLPPAPAVCLLPSQPSLCHLDGIEDRARLVHRLLVLALRHGVGDYSGPGLHVRARVAQDNRAYGDAGVEVVRVICVEHRARVEAARVRLKPCDDLHGAH